MHLRDLTLNSMEPGRPINGDSVRCWSNSIDELVLPRTIQKIWSGELRICQSYLMFNLLETYQIACIIRKSTKKLEIVFPNYTSNGNHYRCTAQNLVFTYS